MLTRCLVYKFFVLFYFRQNQSSFIMPFFQKRICSHDENSIKHDYDPQLNLCRHEVSLQFIRVHPTDLVVAFSHCSKCFCMNAIWPLDLFKQNNCELYLHVLPLCSICLHTNQLRKNCCLNLMCIA